MHVLSYKPSCIPWSNIGFDREPWKDRGDQCTANSIHNFYEPHQVRKNFKVLISSTKFQTSFDTLSCLINEDEDRDLTQPHLRKLLIHLNDLWFKASRFKEIPKLNRSHYATQCCSCIHGYINHVHSWKPVIFQLCRSVYLEINLTVENQIQSHPWRMLLSSNHAEPYIAGLP